MDVMSSILEKSNGPTSETKLLHACNLNLSQFRLYRTFLVDTGLLKACEQEEGVDLFETTGRGREFLRDYARVKAPLSPDLKREKGGDR
ncbi:MAG: winged helix-turn-helix domain-containing protein [Candidatus Bathyarchaeota archaeon]|nr:winged helix-turn-helix domain-containing protein [Candidatus Bathyarchaeota archaeon]